MGFARRFFQSTIKQQRPFIATWKTDNTSSGSSNSDQIKLPLINTGIYNFSVDWGDGNSDSITSWNQAETTHTYASSGTYTITILGKLSGFSFGNSGDRLKILDIQNWGSIKVGSGGSRFFGCGNLNISATDQIDLSGVTNCSGFFRDCTSLTYNSSINNWDVSSVTNFNSFFNTASLFNQNIGNWNMSSATNISSMFFNALAFNNGGSSDINNWDVSNVVTFSVFNGGTFLNSSFNQPLGNWNVGKGVTFNDLFRSSVFNQDISNWDVSEANFMGGMFRANSVFNQDISNWDVSEVTSMVGMFNLTNSFAKSIGDWNLNALVNLSDMLIVSNATIGTNLQEWYSRTLIGWANDVFSRGGVPSNRNLVSTNRRYNSTSYTTGLQFNDAVSARAYLVNTAGWTITGDVQV
jgi:surface protein